MPPKRKKAKGSPPPRKYLTPDDLEIKEVADKGKGLFAKRDLPPNSRIYYEGKEINQEQFDKLVKQQLSGDPKKKDYVEYVMQGGKKGTFVDDVVDLLIGSVVASMNHHPRRRGTCY